MNEKWFSLTVEEIEKKLRTNAATGLSPKAARSRCNKKEAPFFTVKKKSWDKLLLDIIRDFILVMLVLVATFSLFFEGDYIIGSAALTLCVINIALCFMVYYMDRRGAESMADFFTPTARVIRDGKLYIADYKDVVVGDIIVVEKGDVLGCDARLIHSNDLSVTMKLDRKQEKKLQKYAGGAVADNELYAENMSNMLHAGSVVDTGSGRAIVVATGKYTYLGAMTGGITEIASQELPEGIDILRKRFSKLGMIFLLAIIPFCLFSILFGHFTGGKVLLSEVLMVALALGATFTLSRFSNLFVGFLSRYVRKAALSQNSCIIRSVKDMDTLSDMDYLFMLDGSITTDGILHFDSIMTADGEAKGFDRMGKSAGMLADMIGLYRLAQNKALFAGMSSNGEYDTGIDEFIEKSGTDLEALKIRCKINSYLPHVNSDASDMLTVTDRGDKRQINIAFSRNALDECDFALFAGVSKPITEEGKDALKRTFDTYYVAGKRMLIFTVMQDDKKCFAGMLVLREGVDNRVQRAVGALRRSGVKIIAFSNCIGRENAPEIPEMLRTGKRAYFSDFLKRGLPVTHGFGSFDEYCYFDENMICELASHVKSMGKKLGVLSFTDYAYATVKQADVFISCAPIRTGAFGRFEEEIRALEIPGEQSSASCTQRVKSDADVLLMRPKDNNGGLEPIARVIEYCKVGYRNLGNYIKYLICVQVMRIVAIVFPMLFGNITADVRHMLFLGFVLDFLALLVFMSDTRRCDRTCRDMKKEFAEQTLVGFLKSNLKLAISVALGSVLVLLLPNLMSFMSIFGNYAYKAEFTFMALLLMQLLTLLCIYSSDIRNVETHKRLLCSYPFVISLALSVVFVTLCLAIRPLGNFFGVVANPLPYFLLSFVPAIAFGLCYFVMTLLEKGEDM